MFCIRPGLKVAAMFTSEAGLKVLIISGTLGLKKLVTCNQSWAMAQNVKENSVYELFFSFERRRHVFALHKAKTVEPGEEVLMSVAN